MTDIIRAPDRRVLVPLHLRVTGLHRGATAALPAFAKLARASARTVHATGVDPIPGRAREYSEAAAKLGLAVDPIEMRHEDAVLDGGIQNPDLHILHVDEARPSLAALEHARETGYATAGLLVAELPRIGMTGFRYATAEGDTEAYAQAIALMQGLTAVSSNEGSGAFWGPRAPVRTRLAEPALRRSFDRYLERDVGRLLVGLPRTGPAIEATTGTETRPVAVLESETLDDDPSRIAMRVVNEAPFTLRRDQRFLVVEIVRVPEPTLRFRHGVLRRDHLVQVGRAQDVTKADVANQAHLELAAARTADRSRPAVARHDRDDGAGGLLLGLALGLAIGAGISGLATRRSPVATTD